MKPSNRSLRSWLLALCSGSVISSTFTVQAIEYTWDSSATAGIQTGAANWGLTGTNWTIDGGTTRIAWPNTGTDSAFFTGPIAADVTISLNNTNLQVDDVRTGTTSNFIYLNQLSSTSAVRTLVLTGGSYSGSGDTGSQFNIGGGNLSITGTLGTTQFKLTGASDIVKLGAGSLFITSQNHDFTGNIYINQGNLFVNSGNDTSLGNAENDIFINGGALNLQTNALTIASGRTITLGASGGKIGGSVALTIQGQLTGVGSLEKINASDLNLETAANYAGSTTLTAGVLRLQPNGTIPNTSNLTINGTGNFNVRNTNNWTYNGAISGAGTGSVNLNSGTNATLAGNISGVLSVNGNSAGTNATVSGNISGGTSVNVQNSGSPILRLSGTNTYSGVTTVANTGTLILNGNNSGATGAVTVNAGGTLAGSGTIGSATTITGIHAPGGDVNGVQTFTAGIDYAAASILSVNMGTNSASPALRGTFPLGYGGADVTAGIVNIDPTATARVALNSATGDLNLSNAFWNSPQQWLAVDLKGSATAADSNAPISASATLNGSPFNTAAYGTFSFTRADGSTTADSVWLQWTPANPPTWTGAGSTSWATAGNWTPTAPGTGDIVRFHTASTANLATVLGADYDLLGLAVIAPSGPVSISGANTLTLGTGGIDLAFATQNLTISAPLVLSAAQSWTVASGRTLGISGVVSGSGDLTVAGAGKVLLSASNILPNGASAGNLNLNGKLDLNGTSQAINALTGSGVIDNTAAGASALTVGNNDAVFTLGALLQNTSGTLALVKTGAGNLTLTAANAHSGGFTNNGTGIIYPKNNSTFGSGPVVMNGSTIYATGASYTFANSLALNSATLRIGGGNNFTTTCNGPVTATGTSGLSADGGTGGITLGSTLDITGATFTSFANGNTNTITGAISGVGGSLTVTSGTLALDGANGYTGATTLDLNAGSAVSLILRATGTISSSSNVVINESGNFVVRNTVGWVYNGTITGDGTGQINLNTGTNATLAGDISGVVNINANSPGTDATISGDISGATNVTVQGTVDIDGLGAILRLGGANSYSGSTTVTRGSLVLATGNVLPDASPVSIGTATLDAATFTDTAGTLNVTGTAKINLGSSAAALAFADSSGIGTTGVWAGTLELTGAFVSGSSLRFGTTNAGLSDEQLLKITAAGYTGFDLDNNGYLTATSTGSPYDTWKSQITNGLNLRTDDAEGDGFNNLQEFLFGTSPIAGNGSLVTTTSSVGNLVLRWLQRESGATYTLKQSATLATESWSTVASPVPTMDVNQSGAPTDYDYYTVTLPSSGGKLFFRIEGVEN